MSKRYCIRCEQLRIVCRHGLCEQCDNMDDLACFAYVPAIRIRPRNYAADLIQSRAEETYYETGKWPGE